MKLSVRLLVRGGAVFGGLADAMDRAAMQRDPNAPTREWLREHQRICDYEDEMDWLRRRVPDDSMPWEPW